MLHSHGIPYIASAPPNDRSLSRCTVCAHRTGVMRSEVRQMETLSKHEHTPSLQAPRGKFPPTPGEPGTPSASTSMLND